MRMKQQVISTSSSQETQKFAKKLASNLQGTHLLALYGDLGAGKTTFVQGFAKGLKIKKRIISPTFVIIRSYKLKSQNSKVKTTHFISSGRATQRLKVFYHIDLYRVQSESELKGLGIQEIIEDPQNIVAIEWAEKLASFLPQKRWDIRFKQRKGHRRITFQMTS